MGSKFRIGAPALLVFSGLGNKEEEHANILDDWQQENELVFSVMSILYH